MNGPRRIPVLMYHRVGASSNAWERRYCISPERFAEHMHRLAAEDWHAVALPEFFEWLHDKKSLPERSFLLTFDDGFLGVYEHAAPVLEAMGWPATVFLVSRLLGMRDAWTGKENPSGVTYPLMAHHHIAELRDKGFTFHSHTCNHHDLTTLGDEQLIEELAGSRRDLEDLLGEAVTYLAYPYGRYDERVLHATRAAGYQAAFSVQPGFNRHDVDPYRIRRLDVFGTDTSRMLIRKIFFGSNDGSWRQSVRYYSARVSQRLARRTSPRMSG